MRFYIKECLELLDAVVFFFSSRRRHTRYIGDWSSDVCSSDLTRNPGEHQSTIMSARSVVILAVLGTALPGPTPIHAQQTPAANPLDVVPDKMPFDIPYGAPISLEHAEAAIAATVAEARKHDWKLNVAVVDSAGNLVAFQRMDGAQLAISTM